MAPSAVKSVLDKIESTTPVDRPPKLGPVVQRGKYRDVCGIVSTVIIFSTVVLVRNYVGPIVEVLWYPIEAIIF